MLLFNYGDIMLKFKDIEILEAKGLFNRFIGLMFKKNIKHGLLFKNCRSIHTFFMFEEIDVIATDKADTILRKYKSVKPWRIIIAPKNTKNIYELPKKTL